jgi:hypothetical protein
MIIRHATEGLKPGSLCHDLASLIERHGILETLVALELFAGEQAEFALGDKADVKAWKRLSKAFGELARSREVQP